MIVELDYSKGQTSHLTRARLNDDTAALRKVNGIDRYQRASGENLKTEIEY